MALQQLGDGIEHLGDFVRFAPPRGIGLILDAGVVKGGGFLFIDSARGEYAGALELKFLTWSIKAIGLLSTKRPDGSDGWSLLLFVFGQFNVHIAFGIFWTGVGGMIGLHHRSDVDALTAGMRTGALDDVLFPKNPVADAPRIINRYRTLFPVADGNLLDRPDARAELLRAADRVRAARADLRRAQRARRPGRRRCRRSCSSARCSCSCRRATPACRRSSSC